MEIIPGILEKDWGEIERKIEVVKPFAKVVLLCKLTSQLPLFYKSELLLNDDLFKFI